MSLTGIAPHTATIPTKTSTTPPTTPPTTTPATITVPTVRGPSVSIATGSLGPNITALLEVARDIPSTGLPVVPQIAVTLGNLSEPDLTYSSLGQANATSMAWSQPPADTTSRLMEDNLKAYSKSGRLASLLGGLGSELLQGLSGRQGEWQQVAAVYRPGYRELGSPATSGTTAVDALRDAGEAKNTINLKIRTASGKEVDIAIVFGGNGKAIQDSLSIDIRVSQDLDATEQAAIDKLAQGLDAALKGVGGDVPKIDVAGLIAFDAKVIEGVDLKLRVASQRSGLQSFEFRADAAGRSLSLQTATGRLAVNVDLSASAPLGSEEQQRTALQKFLEQFDAANVRAHGEEVLLEQFKAAFSQLNSAYPPPGARPAPKLPEWVLGAEDRAVLTGLADFQASMSGDFDNGSPSKHVTEAGHMRYEVAQATEIKGIAKDSGLAVVQSQTSALHATQERSRNGLRLVKESGNYDVFRIEDKATTTTAFQYGDFELKSASSEENSSRLDQYEKWVDHELVERRNTPYSTRVLRDLVEDMRIKS